MNRGKIITEYKDKLNEILNLLYIASNDDGFIIIRDEINSSSYLRSTTYSPIILDHIANEQRNNLDALVGMFDEYFTSYLVNISDGVINEDLFIKLKGLDSIEKIDISKILEKYAPHYNVVEGINDLLDFVDSIWASTQSPIVHRFFSQSFLFNVYEEEDGFYPTKKIVEDYFDKIKGEILSRISHGIYKDILMSLSHDVKTLVNNFNGESFYFEDISSLYSDILKLSSTFEFDEIDEIKTMFEKEISDKIRSCIKLEESLDYDYIASLLTYVKKISTLNEDFLRATGIYEEISTEVSNYFNSYLEHLINKIESHDGRVKALKPEFSHFYSDLSRKFKEFLNYRVFNTIEQTKLKEKNLSLLYNFEQDLIDREKIKKYSYLVYFEGLDPVFQELLSYIVSPIKREITNIDFNDNFWDGVFVKESKLYEFSKRAINIISFLEGYEKDDSGIVDLYIKELNRLINFVDEHLANKLKNYISTSKNPESPYKIELSDELKEVLPNTVSMLEDVLVGIDFLDKNKYNTILKMIGFKTWNKKFSSYFDSRIPVGDLAELRDEINNALSLYHTFYEKKYKFVSDVLENRINLYRRIADEIIDHNIKLTGVPFRFKTDVAQAVFLLFRDSPLEKEALYSVPQIERDLLVGYMRLNEKEFEIIDPLKYKVGYFTSYWYNDEIGKLNERDVFDAIYFISKGYNFVIDGDQIIEAYLGNVDENRLRNFVDYFNEKINDEGEVNDVAFDVVERYIRHVHNIKLSKLSLEEINNYIPLLEYVKN